MATIAANPNDQIGVRCRIPGGASLATLITYTRRMWLQAPHTEGRKPSRIRISPDSVTDERAEIGGLRVVRDAEVEAGFVVIE